MSGSHDKVIFINEGNTLFWEGLSDENKPHSDPTRWINTATVSAAVKNEAGNEVISGITLAYVTGSNADYRGTVTKAQAATLTEETKYFVEMTASANGFEDGFRRFEVRARYHGTR